MKYFAFAIGLFAICTIAVAQENDMLQTELEEEYYQRMNASPEKSRIYIIADIAEITYNASANTAAASPNGSFPCDQITKANK